VKTGVKPVTAHSVESEVQRSSDPCSAKMEACKTHDTAHDAPRKRIGRNHDPKVQKFRVTPRMSTDATHHSKAKLF
jgi:hypothetical protein